MKRVYASLAGCCLLIAMQAQAFASSNDQAANQQLENELRQFIQQNPGQKQAAKPVASWMPSAKALTGVPNSTFLAALPACDGAQMVTFADRYVLVSDAQAKPCKIYDLSFPTLSSLLGFHTVSKLPVQKFAAKDYLNWMHGNYADVYGGIKNFQSSFGSSAASADQIQSSWVSQLKFRADRKAQFTWVATVGAASIPKSFKASDLEVGNGFQFNPRERATLHAMMGQMSAQNPALFSANQSAWSDLVDNPNGLLERLNFVWNDAEKVYDVIIDGGFFPITGPVTLVDFKAPYKPAMERMVRSVLESAVMRLAGYIVDPLTQRLVTVVLNDTFGFIEDTYNYQMNMMEPALRDAKAASADQATAAVYDAGIDNLFATRSGFFTDYVTAVTQGKQFDWAKVQKIGHAARYKEEKARDISMNNINSKLVLKSGCDSKPYYNYFALCLKNGATDGVYSLLSETSVLFWNLGAPEVYRPSFPSEVVLKRATSRILASGLRITRLPVLDFLTDKLADELEGYAMSGLEDEAFLRSALMNEKHTHGGLDPQGADVMKWLYIQNINPFMVKSEASDTSIIHSIRIQPAPAQGN